MCLADYDGPTFITKTRSTARKPWRCDDCDRRFVPGTTRLRVTGMWDGSFSTYDRCDDCTPVADAMSALGCSWSYGGLLDDAREAVRYHDEAEVGAVAGALFRLAEKRDAEEKSA